MKNKDSTQSNCLYRWYRSLQDRFKLNFDDPTLEQRYRDTINEDNVRFLKFFFIMNILLAGVLVAIGFASRKDARYFVVQLTHIFIDFGLLMVLCRTHRFNHHFGYIVLISFFLTNSQIY